MTLSNAVLTFLLLLNSKSLVKADETSIEDFFWSQDENYIWPGLPKHAPYDIKGDVGEPLYLTPYIESGQIDMARNLSLVTEPLDGLEPGEQPVSYSGFLTVNETMESHTFFWFFPANVSDYTTAPVVIWLQGGPGSSSLFGLLEIHGPFSAVFNDTDARDTIAVPNPYSWTNEANMIYIDNPVGTGFSHTFGGDFAKDQKRIGEDLYDAIIQWLKMFPELQSNPFFAFGESYAGKYVPTISKKIHDENQNNPEIFINFVGLGVGNGDASPSDQDKYAHMMHALSLVDEKSEEIGLQYEAQVDIQFAAGNYTQAYIEWSKGFNYLMGQTGCDAYTDFSQCHFPLEEYNYDAFANKESTRIATHVGWIPFGNDSNAVYYNLLDDQMRSERETLEFLLELYPVLLYHGNLDIICHYTGAVLLIQAMENWSGKAEFEEANSTQWKVNQDEDPELEIAGYLTSVQNLRLLAVRNAGHMVPRSKPLVALEMFRQFLNGIL